MKFLLIASLVVVLLAQSTEAFWNRTSRDVARTTRDIITFRYERSVRHITRLFRGWGKRDADIDPLIADGVLTLEEAVKHLNMDEEDFKTFDDNGDGVIDESEFNDLQIAVEHLSKKP